MHVLINTANDHVSWLYSLGVIGGSKAILVTYRMSD